MNLYRGSFSFPHKSMVLYRPARNEKHAWVRMCKYIEKVDCIDSGKVFTMFDWDKNRGVNFDVKLETEFKEVE
jgi:hypothetical protein